MKIRKNLEQELAGILPDTGKFDMAFERNGNLWVVADKSENGIYSFDTSLQEREIRGFQLTLKREKLSGYKPRSVCVISENLGLTDILISLNAETNSKNLLFRPDGDLLSIGTFQVPIIRTASCYKSDHRIVYAVSTPNGYKEEGGVEQNFLNILRFKVRGLDYSRKDEKGGFVDVSSKKHWTYALQFEPSGQGGKGAYNIYIISDNSKSVTDKTKVAISPYRGERYKGIEVDCNGNYWLFTDTHATVYQKNGNAMAKFAPPGIVHIHTARFAGDKRLVVIGNSSNGIVAQEYLVTQNQS